ncbi:iron ABC transporter permease [Phaeobacter sp. QD34_3]|uniref:FecCD family ABC transporter permease n=1 Tax=unclassified Phaeobacter TaxID=2621772 RepID=UPI00237F6680|nr:MULTISPECIES: iron ABC transporter permease [unclassified Phaeobacter]MDE4133023.1 iron ABC transporter permease [Phaeobacter sp. QD34_3]MDE4136575.1 iron ABC transporter permease [Phaeobacter sp. QD34_24]
MTASREAGSPQSPGAVQTAPDGARLAVYCSGALRRLARLAAAAAVLAALMVADILTGPAMLGLGDVLRGLFVPAHADNMTLIIVRDIRLPSTLMATLVGMSLGVAGVHMQTILGNPLASPYTLGFSAAAGFGAALAILTGFSLPFLPWLTVPLSAFVMCVLAAALVFAFSNIRGMRPEIMVLAGIATLFMFQSAQSLVQYLAAPEVLQAIVFWLFGSLLKASWNNVPIVAVVFALTSLAVLPHLWQLTALRLGDARAAAIGVDVRRLRVKMFALVALLTAAAVAFVGTIGFVGLVAPHIARMLVGEDQRVLLPMAALMGAITMAGSSVLSKLVSPGGVIPIGIVTALIGVPFLFFLILRGQRRHW